MTACMSKMNTVCKDTYSGSSGTSGSVVAVRSRSSLKTKMNELLKVLWSESLDVLSASDM